LNPDRYRASQALLQRARTVIPGGIQLNGGKPLIDAARSPLYFERSRGSRIWDADGNEYVDFIMAYGPFVLGYGHPEVEAAATRQLARGSLMSMNQPLHVRFVESLLERFANAEMGAFFKTGSEATTAAVRVARRATGRRKIARCGYHGWHDWCVPDADFVPAELEGQVLSYDAMRPSTLTAIFDEYPKQVAAVILAPEMIHPPCRETVVALMAAARRDGALFIMDEVKTGVRAPGGSMQAYYGVKPDLTTLSKALGNGWPVAAVIGTRAAMSHGADVLLSATYHGESASMAAAIATLDIVEREGARETIDALGRRLIDGLNEAARRNDIPAVAYGEPIPAMPFLRFTDADPAENARLLTAVYERVLADGILLHPRHLWYISTAHTEAEIDRAVETVDRAMRYVAGTAPQPTAR
jgi:glutamate-1-semialdehyde 2,1-aminomutase